MRLYWSIILGPSTFPEVFSITKPFISIRFMRAALARMVVAHFPHHVTQRGNRREWPWVNRPRRRIRQRDCRRECCCRRLLIPVFIAFSSRSCFVIWRPGKFGASVTVRNLSPAWLPINACRFHSSPKFSPFVGCCFGETSEQVKKDLQNSQL